MTENNRNTISSRLGLQAKYADRDSAELMAEAERHLNRDGLTIYELERDLRTAREDTARLAKEIQRIIDSAQAEIERVAKTTTGPAAKPKGPGVGSPTTRAF